MVPTRVSCCVIPLIDNIHSDLDGWARWCNPDRPVTPEYRRGARPLDGHTGRIHHAAVVVVIVVVVVDDDVAVSIHLLLQNPLISSSRKDLLVHERTKQLRATSTTIPLLQIRGVNRNAKHLKGSSHFSVINLSVATRMCAWTSRHLEHLEL